MLFTEQDLNYSNAMDILDNASYLTEDESIINPTTVPVKEVSRLGYGVVRFDDVDKLAESYGIDYIDAMYAIAESSDMDPEYLAVSVPEYEVIAYPEIVNELANIVIEPISEDSTAYQYVEACLEAWDNTGNEDFLVGIIEDSYIEDFFDILNEANVEPHKVQGSIDTSKYGEGLTIGDYARGLASMPKVYGQRIADEYRDFWGDLKRGASGTEVSLDRKNGGIKDASYWTRIKRVGGAIGKHKAAAAGAVAVGAAGAYGIKKFAGWVQEARNRPKSWIGKKIAALRSIYQKWMQQAQRNPQKAGMIKTAAAKILSIIDALMNQLQRAAG